MRPLLDRVCARAAGVGLNLMGLVDCGRFDAGEPKERRVGRVAPACGTIVVLGSGGRSIPPRLGCTGDAAAVAGWATTAAGGVAALMREHGVACRALALEGGCRVNGARLGEAAGFGTVSPVSGLLLHPEYGPWLRVRVAVLCDGSPFGAVGDASISERFQPCSTCDRPCVRACPAAVHDHREQALAACASHRHGGGCTDGCASRGACPVGAHHRDEPAVALHGHSHELATLQRWYGLGPWRLVPKPLRGGL
jgi:hypothetical protein